MNQILCSTGALLGRPNDRNYRLLSKMKEQLDCDGFEFMIYSSWYPEIEELIPAVKALGLNIPVIHCQKSLGERLCGMKASYDDGNYSEYIMTEEEEAAEYNKGTDEFKINLRVAKEFGADRMVLHLWNGIASDKKIEKNIKYFGAWKQMAEQEGVRLMVENVVCNQHDPLSNLNLLRESYPDVSIVYDTKMAEFHDQTMKVFDSEYEWMMKNGNVAHMHINDYLGDALDWGKIGGRVLPIGAGKIDFEAFFEKFLQYDYKGDYTIEATALGKDGVVDFAMLNDSFKALRRLAKLY